MAINLFIYCRQPADEVRRLTAALIADRQDLFSSYFLIYPARDIDPEQEEDDRNYLEIAGEYDFTPSSLFLVLLNDKFAKGPPDEVAIEAIREKLGADNILILFENEERL